MGVRLSTSYRLLDGTNSDIGLTSVVTDGRLRVGNPNVDTSCGPAGQSSIRITVSTAVGSVIVVTVDAAEALRNVRSAVFARRRGIGRRPWSDRHADHPPNRPLTVRRCGKRGLYQVGRRRLRTTPRRARFATRVWSTSNLRAVTIHPHPRLVAIAPRRLDAGWIVGRRRFELRLRPPEGRRIPSYPTGPHLQL